MASMSRHHWDSTLWKVGNVSSGTLPWPPPVCSLGWTNQQQGQGLFIPRQQRLDSSVLQCYKRTCALDVARVLSCEETLTWVPLAITVAAFFLFCIDSVEPTFCNFTLASSCANICWCAASVLDPIRPLCSLCLEASRSPVTDRLKM